MKLAIVLVAVVAVAALGIGVVARGFTVNGSQGGVATCTIPTNGIVCTTPITNFSPAYGAVPKFTANPVGVGGQPIITTQVISFYRGGAVTWVNMPVGDSELFGSGNYRAVADLTGVVQMSLQAEISTQSANQSAYLRVQFSLDAGTTWADLAATPANGYMNFGCGAACTTPYDLVSLYCNFNCQAAVQVASNALTTPVLLRVMGNSGNGIGDMPVFESVTLKLWIQLTNGIWCNISTGFVTASTFRIQIARPFTGASQSVSCRWESHV